MSQPTKKFWKHSVCEVNLPEDFEYIGTDFGTLTAEWEAFGSHANENIITIGGFEPETPVNADVTGNPGHHTAGIHRRRSASGCVEGRFSSLISKMILPILQLE